MSARIKVPSSETILYARIIFSAAVLCGQIRFALVLAMSATLVAQTGPAYNNWLSTTRDRSLRFHWQGPLPLAGTSYIWNQPYQGCCRTGGFFSYHVDMRRECSALVQNDPELPQIFFDRYLVSADHQAKRDALASVGEENCLALVVGELQAILRYPCVDSFQSGVEYLL